MKAVVHQGKAGFEGVSYTDIDSSSPGSGEIKVRLKAAGLNHRDLFVLQRHKEKDPAFVIGSDGAGVIEEIGEGTKGVQSGDEVVIIPSLGWEKNSPAPPDGFEILGFPGHGTFAETIIVPAENVVAKPKHLSWEEAGVLPLGALTAYRALSTRGNVQPGQTVFIPGAGSGVATFLLQMSKAAGARVIVTSRSKEKQAQAVELGADVAIDSNADWGEFLSGETIDLVIESVGAATWNRSLKQLCKGGTMVMFGASAGDEVSLNLREFFYGQYNLLGSTMGSSEEFREMVTFIERHEIKSVVDETFPLQQAVEAMKRLEVGKQFGKIALMVE